MHPKKRYFTLSTATKFHWFHWMVLGASLLMTFLAWFVTDQQNQQKSSLQYKYQSEHLIDLVRERLNLYEGALYSSVAALHLIPNELSAKKWKEYSDTLSIESKYPGINGIGFIYYIKPDQLGEYLKNQQAERPSFSIYPTHTQDEFWPITYLEPEALNHKAIGLDLAHETNRLAGAKKARDTGTAQITGPITLVQDSQKTPGFLFFVPHYLSSSIPNDIAQRQKTFIGNVYAAFIMNNLMDGALQNTNRLVNFSIKDGDSQLYNELTSASEDFDPNPLFSKTFQIDLYGRTWTFDIRSSLIFRSQNQNHQPLLILLAGIFIEAMLVILFIVLINGNRKAVRYAESATEDLVKNKQELESAYNRMSRAFDAMLDGLVVMSSSGTILEVNNTTLRLFGYNHDELMNKNIRCLMPAQKNTRHTDYVKDHLQDALDKRRLLQGKRKDGTIFPVFLHVSEGEEADSKIFIGVIHDLTDKQKDEQQIAEKEAMLSAAVHSSLAGFAMMDRSGRLFEANRALAEWLGYTSKEMVGMPYANIRPDNDRQAVENTIADIFKGDPDALVSKEQLYKSKNGTLLWGLLSPSIVKNNKGEIQYLFAQVIDITQSKQLSLELEARNTELVRSNAELDQFAYVASHDLKAPLNAIHKLTGWIEEDCEDTLPDSAKAHLTLLKNRTTRMAKLLDDLLLFSRAGRVDYQFESIQIGYMVNDITMLQGISDHFVCTAPDITVIAPRVPLEQILRNLIGNAVKHHPAKTGNIKISIDKNPNGFYLRVSDDGEGIPAHLHVKALEIFQTLKPRDEVEGSGLGLALCKKIVESYHGSLQIESIESQGTTIVIFLPIAQQPTMKECDEN